jgi:hypothetical protein
MSDDERPNDWKEEALDRLLAAVKSAPVIKNQRDNPSKSGRALLAGAAIDLDRFDIEIKFAHIEAAYDEEEGSS